jgi:tagatose-1,6-bisphosphate aldolase
MPRHHHSPGAVSAIRIPRRDALRALLGVAGVTVATQTGCVGALSQLMWVANGHQIPAKCTALDGQRTAVVTVAGPTFRREDDTITRLNRKIASLLAVNVPKIDLVAPEFVDRWRDDNRWDEVDYVSLGRGVDAKAVVAIDIFSFTTIEGSTTLRGKATWKAAIWQTITENGTLVFREGPIDTSFPEHGSSGDIDQEDKFRGEFIDHVATKIATYFYAFDQVKSTVENPIEANRWG